MSNTTKVALYARVSTSDKGQDPELQLRELREHCRLRGWDVYAEYVDHVSGTKESRPQLNKLMEDAKRRRFKAVLVWKFDRFARSISHLLRALGEFKALGIDFISLTQAVDTSTPAGKMLFGIVGLFAEFEHDLISERVIAGMRNARSKGKHLGRPRRIVDLAAVRSRMASGEKQRAIAKDMGISEAALCRRLKAEKKP
jgi:DNA invertase Pin-like site-specific DNA recombinase